MNDIVIIQWWQLPACTRSALKLAEKRIASREDQRKKSKNMLKCNG